MCYYSPSPLHDARLHRLPLATGRKRQRGRCVSIYEASTSRAGNKASKRYGTTSTWGTKRGTIKSYSTSIRRRIYPRALQRVFDLLTGSSGDQNHPYVRLKTSTNTASRSTNSECYFPRYRLAQTSSNRLSPTY